MRVVLPEIVVPGKRLGRHISHDRRSLRYLLPEATATSVAWERHGAILDQGNLGSCTGNALVGALETGPLYDALVVTKNPTLLNEQIAIDIYSDAEKLDGGAGLPSEDDGSSGLSVAQVAKARGLISGYQHATTIGQAHAALQAGPFITGTYWFSGMDNPSAEGIVKATGTIRGGHEYLCRQYDVTRDLWWMDNSWGPSFGVQGRFAYDSTTFEKLLAAQGDVTSLTPITAPAPTPTPDPQPLGTSVAFTADQLAVLDKWATGPWASRKPSAAYRAARGL